MSIGQILLLPKPLLEKRVLSDERIEIYAGGRDDIRSGQIDRRVLATLAYLAESGLEPTVTCLKSGHGFLTASGNVSEHSSGNAVDIAAINGVPILGHQEAGGITDQSRPPADAPAGHDAPAPDHLAARLRPEHARDGRPRRPHPRRLPARCSAPTRKLGQQALAVLKPGQWSTCIDRLGEIENPVVPTKPSKYAIPVKKHKRASDAHAGE